MNEKNEEAPKKSKVCCPVIDPFEEIIEKLNIMNQNLEIIKEYLWDMTRKE